MTKEQTIEAAKVMLAWAEETSRIQARKKNALNAEWIDFPFCGEEDEIGVCEGIGWNFEVYDYRIKPDPKYRPYKTSEEVMDAIKEHGLLIRMYSWEDWRPIITIHADEVFVWGVEQAFNFEKALRDISFADGTPFGIKE